MWTAPSLQGVWQCFGQIACVHMSGLFVRSHMNAGQDGFRDKSSQTEERPHSGTLDAVGGRPYQQNRQLSDFLTAGRANGKPVAKWPIRSLTARVALIL